MLTEGTEDHCLDHGPRAGVAEVGGELADVVLAGPVSTELGLDQCQARPELGLDRGARIGPGHGDAQTLVAPDRHHLGQQSPASESLHLIDAGIGGCRRPPLQIDH